MSESSSQRSKELKFLHIMKSLPCLNAKINSWIQNYERMKHSSPLLGIGLWILELVLKTWWIMFMLLLFCLPSSILNSQPGEPHNHFHFFNESKEDLILVYSLLNRGIVLHFRLLLFTCPLLNWGGRVTQR